MYICSDICTKIVEIRISFRNKHFRLSKCMLCASAQQTLKDILLHRGMLCVLLWCYNFKKGIQIKGQK